MISRDDWDAYAESVLRLSGRASGQFSKMLDAMGGAWADMPPSELRKTLIGAMEQLLSDYGDPAAYLAADFMARCCPDVIGGISEAVLARGASPEQIEKAVRSALGLIYRDDPAPGAMASRLGGHIGRYVADSARKTTIETARARGKGWARVPSGLKTCGYCLMLASRGFDYSSEGAAIAGSHDGCDCMVIAADTRNRFEASVLEGYDPGHLYRVWKDCVNTLGCAPDDHDAVTAELARRDPAWIWRGIVPEVNKSFWSSNPPKSKQEQAQRDRESITFAALAEHGYKVEVLPRGNVIGVKYPDIRFAGQAWEVKAPNGSSKTTIDNILKKATNQSVRIVIDNHFSGLSDLDARKAVAESLANRRRIEELILIDKSRQVMRMRK
jgi:hypothetical protein